MVSDQNRCGRRKGNLKTEEFQVQGYSFIHLRLLIDKKIKKIITKEQYRNVDRETGINFLVIESAATLLQANYATNSFC